MNSTPNPPAHPSTSPVTDSSLHLVAGLAIGLALGGALVGALLYRMRPQPPKPWHGRVRDELAEQLKQLQQVAAAIGREIERG